MKAKTKQKIKTTKDKSKSLQSSGFPIIGVLGCMAERLKTKLLEEKAVDFVCGPDAYRDIPRLLDTVLSSGQKEANTRLSLDETYADIEPVRATNSASAFVSIMRGCNNMCAFCIVPFTRGRERSRQHASILQEVAQLADQGVREVVLLGQNVNGYHDISLQSTVGIESSLVHTSDQNNSNNNLKYQASPGFKNLFHSRVKDIAGVRFADLLRDVAAVNPEIRVRFTSPHPKDFPPDVLDAIASTHNICKSIHLPVQSGSSSVLERMRRGYSREAFLALTEDMRRLMPQVALSTDVIAGFCGETEAEHADTVSLMRQVAFDQAFMFAYSLRDKTHAAHTMVHTYIHILTTYFLSFY
jgi:tRNA A37 methylthiotransferase MiaB